MNPFGEVCDVICLVVGVREASYVVNPPIVGDVITLDNLPGRVHHMEVTTTGDAGDLLALVGGTVVNAARNAHLFELPTSITHAGLVKTVTGREVQKPAHVFPSTHTVKTHGAFPAI